MSGWTNVFTLMEFTFHVITSKNEDAEKWNRTIEPLLELGLALVSGLIRRYQRGKSPSSTLHRPRRNRTAQRVNLMHTEALTPLVVQPRLLENEASVYWQREASWTRNNSPAGFCTWRLQLCAGGCNQPQTVASGCRCRDDRGQRSLWRSASCRTHLLPVVPRVFIIFLCLPTGSHRQRIYSISVSSACYHQTTQVNPSSPACSAADRHGKRPAGN